MSAVKGKTQPKVYRESFSKLVVGKEKAGAWVKGLRQRAFERFKALGLPNAGLEAWKYINLEPLLDATYLLPEHGHTKGVDANEKNRLVFMNGIYSPELSSVDPLPKGVILENLASSLDTREKLIKPYLGFGLESEANAFAAINTFSFRDGAFLYIPENTVIEGAIRLLFISFAEKKTPFVFYPRVLVRMGDHSTAKLIVDHVGLREAKSFGNTVCEIHLGVGASLDYTEIEQSPRDAFQFKTKRFYLKEQSSLNMLSFSQGGAVIRDETSVTFGGENGFASLKGLSVLKGASQIYQHANVYHESGRCVSRQFFKNILAGKAKSEFNSLVAVRPGAQKSDSRQLNRNLLLSDLARCYSRPQLRIDADDVSCTHGATVGQLEKDELFYLRSRGLSKELARLVMTYGFADEILEEIQDEALRGGLETLVREELERMIKEQESGI